jgi:zinc protease
MISMPFSSQHLAWVALALWSAAAVAQEAPRVSPLAHERYRLDNGLEVILAPDRSAPQVVVDIWYRVGSKDERRDRTGFAHLFEHLMFMGTQRAPNFDVIMEEAGGANNASTSTDRTNYFDWGPSSMLPSLLWLEADRLERLDLDMTQEDLEAQRGVVLNEYRQNYENRPYGKAELAMRQLLYPEQHPYHIGTIGLPEHIEAATLEDVIDFFQTFYVPNNASLVVAGDFDSTEVRPLIDSLFGSLPRGDDPPRAEIPAILMDQPARRTLVDQVRLPMLQVGWHSPPQYQRGDAEMDLLAGLLGDAPNGLLYRRLVVEEALAADLTCFQASAMLGSIFLIQVTALPEADLGRVEAVVDAVVREATAGAIGEQELAPYRAAYELALLRPVDNLRDRADLLNQYAFHFGEPDSLERDLERYRGVTADTLRSMANGVFGASGRAIVTILPESKAPVSNARDQRPPDFKSGDLVLDVERASLGSGLELRYFERPQAPFTALRVFLPFGSGLDGPGREGAVALLFDLLDEGAVLEDGSELSATQFAEPRWTCGYPMTPRWWRWMCSARTPALPWNCSKPPYCTPRSRSKTSSACAASGSRTCGRRATTRCGWLAGCSAPLGSVASIPSVIPPKAVWRASRA